MAHLFKLPAVQVSSGIPSLGRWRPPDSGPSPFVEEEGVRSVHVADVQVRPAVTLFPTANSRQIRELDQAQKKDKIEAEGEGRVRTFTSPQVAPLETLPPFFVGPRQPHSRMTESATSVNVPSRLLWKSWHCWLPRQWSRSWATNRSTHPSTAIVMRLGLASRTARQAEKVSPSSHLTIVVGPGCAVRGQVPQAIQIELALLRVPGRWKQQPSLRGLVGEGAVAMPLQPEQQRTSRQSSSCVSGSACATHRVFGATKLPNFQPPRITSRSVHNSV